MLPRSISLVQRYRWNMLHKTNIGREKHNSSVEFANRSNSSQAYPCAIPNPLSFIILKFSEYGDKKSAAITHMMTFMQLTRPTKNGASAVRKFFLIFIHCFERKRKSEILWSIYHLIIKLLGYELIIFRDCSTFLAAVESHLFQTQLWCVGDCSAIFDFHCWSIKMENVGISVFGILSKI